MDEKNIKHVIRITYLSVLANILLCGIKLILGVWGRSQAVIADAVHSLSDLSTDIAILFGVRFWSKPADKHHPYGHRKVESLVTAFIGCVLVGVGGVIGFNAVLYLLGKKIMQQPHQITLIAAVVSIVVKEVLFRWTRSVGRKCKSAALVANAWHHRSDALSSVVVAVSLLIAVFYPHGIILDSLGALVVGCFILFAAFNILIPAFNEIIDTGASSKDLNILKHIALSVEGVKSIHALRTRRVGPGWFVDLHVQLDGGLTVAQGHHIAGAVKHRLVEQGPDILDVIVHMEPY